MVMEIISSLYNEYEGIQLQARISTDLNSVEVILQSSPKHVNNIDMLLYTDPVNSLPLEHIPTKDQLHPTLSSYAATHLRSVWEEEKL